MPFNLPPRRIFGSAVAIALIGTSAVAMIPAATAEPAPAAKKETQRPNILVILMDDRYRRRPVQALLPRLWRMGTEGAW